MMDGSTTFGLSLPTGWHSENAWDCVRQALGEPIEAKGNDLQDWICPDRAKQRLVILVEVIDRVMALPDKKVLFATGHPGGLLSLYCEMASAAASVDGLFTIENRIQFAKDSFIQAHSGVVMLEQDGGLPHTHSGEPMKLLLQSLRDDDRRLPDLVIADHGWLGSAAEAGIACGGFADTNDTALFLAESEGRINALFAMDDSSPAHTYRRLGSLLSATFRRT
jgi:glyoxylase-like metal-dependent hydrolase (beta-lactamase superfamily II)